MRVYETDRLFYNKFLNKVEIYNPLSHIFRKELQKPNTFSHAREEIDTLYTQYKAKMPMQRGWGSQFVREEDLFDAITIYRILVKRPETLLRVETSFLNVYSNDYSWLVKLGNSISDKKCALYQPKQGMTLEPNTIYVNRPVEYKYKVTLGKKLGAKSFAKWVENNPSLAKMGKKALSYCYEEQWVKGYYFYVKDDKSLTLASLLVGDNIQRIDTLVYIDK